MRPAIVLFSALALVSTANAAEKIPAGTVACLNRNAAADYQVFSKSSPDFADDLISRATCYKLKDAAEVVKRSSEGGFAQYQLLSGHKVWVPVTVKTVPVSN